MIGNEYKRFLIPEPEELLMAPPTSVTRWFDGILKVMAKYYHSVKPNIWANLDMIEISTQSGDMVFFLTNAI